MAVFSLEIIRERMLWSVGGEETFQFRSVEVFTTMATIVNNDIWELRVWSLLGEQVGVNTFHWRASAVAAAPTDAQSASHFDALIDTEYKAILNNVAAYRGVTFQRVFPLPRTRAAIATTGAGVGTGGASPLPKQVAGVITWLTPFAGPAFRGRSYLPFPSEEHNTSNGVPQAAYTTACNTLATLLITPQTVLGGPGQTVTWTRVLANLLDNIYIEVDGFLSRPRWATQKKRGDYGQRNISPI
jgi:hypothetical protein